MFEVRRIFKGQRRLVTIMTAIFACLALASSLEAQDKPFDKGTGKPIVSKAVQRSASSKASRAPTVDPSKMAHLQPNDIDDEPIGVPLRKLFSQPDPSLQIDLFERDSAFSRVTSGVNELSGPDIVFAGIQSPSGPVDTVGDVGPNHYIQMTNPGVFQVFEHDGTTTGPVAFQSLWDGTDLCGTNGVGDPIVVYDHLADRWLMLQFAFNFVGSNPTPPYFLCFALSKSETPDTVPANWYLWSVNVGIVFPDYPKLGVWPDAYYMTTHEGGNSGVFAIDRANMLNGNVLQWVKFVLNKPIPNGVRSTRVLPADLDGAAPPAGSPGIFFRTVADSQDIVDSNDRLEVYEFNVDWGNTIASTFNIVDDLRGADGLSDFSLMSCDRTSSGLQTALRDCIPVPGNGTVDALSNRAMMQLKYRNFGTHESMVVNQTVDVAAALNALNPGLGFPVLNEVAGVRWYELRRNSGDTDWSIYQQGTFAPQSAPADEPAILHRWMGSVAMDGFGNIALGYSVASDDVLNPAIRYVGRNASDPLGTLPQGELSIIEGTTAPVASGFRWGDYSAMSVDPADDCTFWYTTHRSVGETPRTSIASFHFNGCSDSPFVLAVSNQTAPSVPEGLPGYVADGSFSVSITDGASCTGTTYNITATPVAGSSPLGNTPAAPTPIVNATAAGSPYLFNAGAGTYDVSVTETGSCNQVTNPELTTATVPDQPSADLLITKTADRNIAIAGDPQPLVYTVKVTNAGPYDAVNVSVADILPAGVSNPVTSNECAEGAAGTPTCSLGTIPAGAFAAYTVSVDVDASTLGVIVNEVIVSSDTIERDPESNVASVSITVGNDDPFVLAISNQTAPLVPEGFPGYVADGSFSVSITDGASCTGTTYNITATPVAGSSPLGGTPLLASPISIINTTAAGSPHVFSAGAGTYDVSVTATGPCYPAVNPEVTTVIVPNSPLPPADRPVPTLPLWTLVLLIIAVLTAEFWRRRIFLN